MRQPKAYGLIKCIIVWITDFSTSAISQLQPNGSTCLFQLNSITPPLQKSGICVTQPKTRYGIRVSSEDRLGFCSKRCQLHAALRKHASVLKRQTMVQIAHAGQSNLLILMFALTISNNVLGQWV
jgi:hypothetical protein